MYVLDSNCCICCFCAIIFAVVNMVFRRKRDIKPVGDESEQIAGNQPVEETVDQRAEDSDSSSVQVLQSAATVAGEVEEKK
ncbi:hypothetical protein GCM10020331_097510 [Ectobacillus funiculus]